MSLHHFSLYSNWKASVKSATEALVPRIMFENPNEHKTNKVWLCHPVFGKAFLMMAAENTSTEVYLDSEMSILIVSVGYLE